MSFESDCALMAGASYFSNRHDNNRFPVLDSWTKIINSYRIDPNSGFEAVSFRHGKEIVISFVGTSNLIDKIADANLAAGNADLQLLQAAAYYLEIKAKPENANAHIIFTGHSLGGGLAALMSVFFNEKAITFDQAPFARAAWGGTKTAIIEYLQNLKDPYGQPLYTMQSLQTLAPDLLSFTNSVLGARTSNISGKYMQGEALTSSSPYKAFSVLGALIAIKHGETGITDWDLHSQALLTAFLEDDRFRQVTYKLTDLLDMIFDKNLFYNDPNDQNPKINFIDRLVRYQRGTAPGGAVASKMLTHFTKDMEKIAGASNSSITNEDVIQALTAFAMQMYYKNPEAATNADKVLFDTLDVTGGVHFKTSDVAASIKTAEGFTMYFQNYLDSLPANESAAILSQLPELLDWYVQAGSSGMTAIAGDEHAFMLGGNGNDKLTGGSYDDVMVGGQGNDQLNGGGGNDTLIGGIGIDTYIYNIGDGSDTIIDEDKQGRIIIKKDGLDLDKIVGTVYKVGGANTWKNADGSITVTHNSPWKIVLEDGNEIQLGDANLEAGDYGINLIDIPVTPETFNAISLDAVDNEHINHQDSPDYGTTANDKIIGGAGNDWVANWNSDGLYGGDDWIIGGTGNDVLSSASHNGKDTLEGDAGIDVLFGNSDSNKLYCDTPGEMEQLITDGETAQSINTFGEIASGGDGNDFIYGGNTKDLLFGGKDNDLQLFHGLSENHSIFRACQQLVI